MRRRIEDPTEYTLPTIDIEEGEVEELILNMGPQHPSTHGVLRLVLKLAGERVVGCIPVMGYLHRGLEKIFEWRTYHQGIRYADQADYVSNMLNEHAYAGAMEAIGDIDVPRRAEFLDMLEELCGSRMNFNYYRPGGVLYDFPTGWVSKLSRFLDRYEKNIEEDYVTILDQNEIFLDRTVGVGTIPAELAKAYGLTGPMLRGSGVDWDLRRDRPYSIYPELTSLKPVIYTEGDAYARYRVRLGEMRLAIALIREGLED